MIGLQVRVHAAGVNPVDFKTRAGGRSKFLGEPPFTVGWDVSGTVTKLGAGVTRFRVGDEVFGMPWFPREATVIGTARAEQAEALAALGIDRVIDYRSERFEELLSDLDAVIDLAGLCHLVEDGKLQVHVDEVFDLDRAADAHRLAEAGHGGGKIVLRVA